MAARRLPVWLVTGAGLLSTGAVGGLASLFGGAVSGRLGTALFYGLVFLPLWVTASLGGLAERRTVWRSERSPALALGAGVLLGLAALGLTVLVAAAAGAVRSGQTAGGIGAAPGVGLALLVFAYQAGAEEILFRGWIQPAFCARLGPSIGLAVVAVAFGLLHLVGARHGLLAMINLVLAGLMFGLLALRTGGLWAAFGAHAAWNWGEACALGLDPNPGVGGFGSLADFDLAGPALWSGGADGLNGSLALTLVLAAIVIGLACATVRRP